MSASQSPPADKRHALSKCTQAVKRLTAVSRTIVHHAKNFVGAGIICSIAYFDPGNWSVDIQAGVNFGYRPMLFVLLMAGLGAIVLQTLACKLGCVTGIDLASHCRLLLYNHPKHPRIVRCLVLYPLYVVSEIAIISTDLAELLGSAIGICLLFPKLPLWAGVVSTAGDVLIFLAFTNPSGGQGLPRRIFEFVIIGLVFTVFSCFFVLLVKVQPDWHNVFLGYLPSKGLFQFHPDAVYAAISILGATVMPHALFLGSSLAAQDRVSLVTPHQPELPSTSDCRTLRSRFKRFIVPLFRISRGERMDAPKDYRSRHGERENNSLTFIRQHLTHTIVDVVTSLITLAVPINSAILILAATVLYQGAGIANDSATAGLFDAHDLIKTHVGSGAGYVFALALLCSGQSASITATLAGQIVSEGFIEWRVSPFLRRLITRLISLVPSVVVTLAVGRSGINTLLVASQVVLSVVLPFIAFPLIYLTSSKVVMRVRKLPPPLDKRDGEEFVFAPDHASIVALETVTLQSQEKEIEEKLTAQKVEVPSVVVSETIIETIDFSNGRLLSYLSYAIWSVVLLANAYAIAKLTINRGV